MPLGLRMPLAKMRVWPLAMSAEGDSLVLHPRRSVPSRRSASLQMPATALAFAAAGLACAAAPAAELWAEAHDVIEVVRRL